MSVLSYGVLSFTQETSPCNRLLTVSKSRTGNVEEVCGAASTLDQPYGSMLAGSKVGCQPLLARRAKRLISP